MAEETAPPKREWKFQKRKRKKLAEAQKKAVKVIKAKARQRRAEKAETAKKETKRKQVKAQVETKLKQQLAVKERAERRERRQAVEAARPKGELSEGLKEDSIKRAYLKAQVSIYMAVMEARADPVAFIELVMRTTKGEPIVLEPFHKEWVRMFHKSRRVHIEASRGHAKTTCLIGYLVWAIGDNPNIRIKLFAQSENKARERLGMIADMIASDPQVKMVFPRLKPGTGVWHKSAIVVERTIKDPNPTLSASGITGSAEGGRADLLAFDDISDQRNAIMFPQHRETIKKKVYEEILPMLEPTGRAVSIGTPHHSQDICSSLRKNPEWESYIYAVGPTEEDPYEPLWASKFPREVLKKIRLERGSLTYDRCYRCKMISDATALIKSDYIHYYDSTLLGDPWRYVCVQAYDLAISQSKKADFFACVTLLFDPDRNYVFVADAWQAKLGFVEQAQEIVAMHRQWKPDQVIIEETGYQSALRGYILEVAENPLPIVPMRPGNVSKSMRLSESVASFEGGRIFFNPRLDPQVNLEVHDRGNLIGQLLDFPIGSHDDLVDAFAYGFKALQVYHQDDEDSSDWAVGEDGFAARLSIL